MTDPYGQYYRQGSPQQRMQASPPQYRALMAVPAAESLTGRLVRGDQRNARSRHVVARMQRFQVVEPDLSGSSRNRWKLAVSRACQECLLRGYAF
jgi:hypothetical protein